ncbi:MAG: hypothetical protein QOE62_2715 [Actinomycetota bacterium]|nr:hypothetical protein [Actinomycetota bacterium]
MVCTCGNRWRLHTPKEPELLECAACGARPSEIVDLGQVRPSDADVWRARADTRPALTETPTGAYLGDRVHQATGMVSAQLGCGVAEALAQMMILAAKTNEPLDELAEAVVQRRIRFDSLGTEQGC